MQTAVSLICLQHGFTENGTKINENSLFCWFFFGVFFPLGTCLGTYIFGNEIRLNTYFFVTIAKHSSKLI